MHSWLPFIACTSEEYSGTTCDKVRPSVATMVCYTRSTPGGQSVATNIALNGLTDQLQRGIIFRIPGQPTCICMYKILVWGDKFIQQFSKLLQKWKYDHKLVMM